MKHLKILYLKEIILFIERNIEQKRIFVRSDRRNGWTIIESVFCFYPENEIANFNSEGMKDNITLIFCLYMFPCIAHAV